MPVTRRLGSHVRLGLAAVMLVGSAAHAEDCNDNGIDDAVEISEETSPDCNGNGVPDACDLQIVGERYVEGHILGTVPRDLTISDLDRDGDDDFVLVNREQFEIILTRGDGTFAAPVSYPLDTGPIDSFSHGVVAEVTGDEFSDVVIRNRRFDEALDDKIEQIFVFPGLGEGTLGEPLTVSSSSDVSRGILVGDMNRDTLDDILLLRDLVSVSVLLNRGDGQFDAQPAWEFAPEIRAALLINVVGDESPEIVVRNSDENLIVLSSEGDGTFTPSGDEVFIGERFSFQAIDFDLDGVSELLISNSSETAIYRNDSGTFVREQSIAGASADSRAVDVDDDGDMDLVHLSGDENDYRITVLTNEGLGVFQPSDVMFHVLPRVIPPIRAVPFRRGASETSGLLVEYGPEFGSRTSRILELQPYPRSEDCNQNGVPDECERELRDCRDCNDNGVPDANDVASGESVDANGNGVPDSCEPHLPQFELRYDAPNWVQGDPGATIEFPVIVKLHSAGFPAGEPGADQWVMTLTAESAAFVDFSVDGTIAAPEPEGLLSGGILNVGFLPVPPRSFCRPEAQVSNECLLSFDPQVSTDITASPSPVLRLTVRTTAPTDGVGVARLGFTTEICCCGPILTDEPPVRSDADSSDGAGGTGGLIRPGVNRLGRSVDASFHSKEILIYGVKTKFFRGDANDDGSLDVSDPIVILNKLFVGGVELPCRDAADGNDDGQVDISDPIFLLTRLFVGGVEPIPAPGPPGPDAECDVDPGESDGQGCAVYTSCGG